MRASGRSNLRRIIIARRRGRSGVRIGQGERTGHLKSAYLQFSMNRQWPGIVPLRRPGGASCGAGAGTRSRPSRSRSASWPRFQAREPLSDLRSSAGCSSSRRRSPIHWDQAGHRRNGHRHRGESRGSVLAKAVSPPLTICAEATEGTTRHADPASMSDRILRMSDPTGYRRPQTCLGGGRLSC